MLYACKVAWQYVLGGHVGEEEALQALLEEWETMFPSNRERRDDLKRAFKGAREYAERDGALHPSPSGPKSASADDVVGEDLLDKLYEMTFTPRWDNKPDALPDTVTLDGEGIAKAGSLHLIMAGTKQGKSTVCGALYAAAIRPDLDDLNALGFKVNLPDTAPAALYFDTEQEDGETWTAWSRALARAGYKEGDDLPDYVDGTHISLTNISNPLHRQALVLHLMDTVDGLGLVIIDGIGDLITNVNDPEQVDLLMNKLRTTASLRKICLFVTLHTNPKQQPSNGDTKARGHLGSDALRRARSYIRVSKDKVGIHTIAVEGNRAGRDDVKVFFRWSDEHHRHIKCDKDEPVPLTSSDAQLKIILDELMGDTTHLHSVLEKMLMERLGKSDRTCRNKIGFAFAQGWINEPLGRKKGYRFVRSQPEEEPDDMLF
jgi:hypothetical protein